MSTFVDILQTKSIMQDVYVSWCVKIINYQHYDQWNV